MKYFSRIMCAVTLFVGPTLHACLWDRDTIARESAKFPGVLQIISGNFARHSKEFYIWRRDTCLTALAKDPNHIALYDDLAVAHHKLGDQSSAIAVMLEKEKRKPGLYETYSNLGTFYIYAGDLRAALQYIDKALAINANAHFGREKYQKWLVEWVLAEKPTSFATFVVNKDAIATGGKASKDPQITSQQRRAAITGVLGMMLFADYDNPLLQEALGDLLKTIPKDDETRLSGLAYAVYSLALEKVPRDGREYMLNKMKDVHWVKLSDVYAHIAAGEALAKTVREDEMRWIVSGLDANAEFEKKYLKRDH